MCDACGHPVADVDPAFSNQTLRHRLCIRYLPRGRIGGQGQVAEPVAGQARGLTESERKWAESVGNVAAPLLAGFSLTSVIMVSEDAGKFRWPDAAIVCLTVAAITLIAALECSKYAYDGHPHAAGWYRWARASYHTGIVALLLGLGFVLAPLHAVGPPAAPRWVACSMAFAASVGFAITHGKELYGKQSAHNKVRNGRH